MLRFATYDPDLIMKDSVIPYAGKWRTAPEKIGIDVLDSFLQQIEKISFDETECEGAGQKPRYYIRSIDHLLEMAKERGLDIGTRNQSPYFFNGRSWERIEAVTFQRFLQEAGVKQGIPYGIIRDHLFVKKLVEQFVSVARFPVQTTSEMPKINLRNGTLHFTQNGAQLKPFDKQDGLCYQLDYDYDISAIAPQFKEFLNRVLPNVAVRKLIFQYIGYVFLPHLNLEKVLFLYGGGANGKSVFLNVIQALIGSEQCCAYSLEGLTRKETQRAELGNFVLNVCSEISTNMGAADIFKKIASREPLQAKYLYKQPFIVKDYATSIFAMNELPKDVEQTGAFFRRFLIVPFDVRIPDEEQDRELATKIIDSEMSGVLNYVVQGAKSLLREGKFDIPPEVEGVVKTFRQESDSVQAFLDEGGYSPGIKKWKSLKDIYDLYKKRCLDDGLKPVAKRTLAKRLRNLGYEVSQADNKEKTTVVYVERAVWAERAE